MACVDREMMLERVRRLTLKRLAERLEAATVTHSNSDGRWSPSQWNYNSAGERHGLATAAAWSVSGTTATLTLSYTVNVMQ